MDLIWKTVMVKIQHEAKILPENSLPLTKNRKIKNILLTYDVEDHVIGLTSYGFSNSRS